MNAVKKPEGGNSQKARPVRVEKIFIGRKKPLCLIAGPCVIESAKGAAAIAGRLKAIAGRVGIPLIFKASYDKANRTSVRSFRGPGLKEGLSILASVRKQFAVPVLSDVHSPEDAEAAGDVLDVLQIPAFLCRQTDLIIAAARTGKVVNIKKGQFLAPEDMMRAAEKAVSTGNKRLLLTERGTSFGYHRLVNDFRSVAIMREMGYPVVYDATHSVQIPGGLGTSSGGESRFVPLLAQAAVACGSDAVFMEVHPDPKNAKSDGPNSIALSRLEKILVKLKQLREIQRRDE